LEKFKDYHAKDKMGFFFKQKFPIPVSRDLTMFSANFSYHYENKFIINALSFSADLRPAEISGS